MIDIKVIVNGQQSNIVPKVYDSAQLQDNLEHSGGISLSWKSKTDTEIPMGSYVTYNGLRYILLDPYAPSKEGGPKNTRACYYKYDVQFKHPQNMLEGIPFYIKSRDAYGGNITLRTTTYTGYPYVIAQKVVDFMAEYANDMQDDFFAETVGLTKDGNNKWQPTWTFNIPSENNRSIITVAFDGTNLKAVPDCIANAIGCNVFWDWSKKEIRFVAGTRIDGKAYNCFHVLGGTTNMGKSTTSGGYAAVTQRLTLDDMYPNSIIDCRPVDEHGNRVGMRQITDLIFDDIYPKLDLYLSDVKYRKCHLTDETGAFIVDTISDNLEDVTYKDYIKWYCRLKNADGSYFHLDQRYIIQDKPLSLLFQIDFDNADRTSGLVGHQFELTYFPDSKIEWDRTDDKKIYPDYNSGFHTDDDSYRIASVAEGEIILPASEGRLAPRDGDKVTLVNYTNLNISKAKSDLAAAASEVISLMQTPAGEYSETVIFGDGDKRISAVMVGDETPFEKNVPLAQRKHGPVVTAVNWNLDTNVAEVTVGSWSRKTKTGGTADKVETVTISANKSTMGGDNYSDGHIGDGYYNSNNSDNQSTINQTIVKPDSLFTAYFNNTIDVVTCDVTGKAAMETNVVTKVICQYMAKDIKSICYLMYTNEWPYTQEKVGEETVVRRIEAFLEGTDEHGATVSTPLVAANTAYKLKTGVCSVRIKIPKGFDMSKFNNELQLKFIIGHPAFTEREAILTIETLKQGENSMRLDLDNEADMVAVNSEGKVRFARSVVTQARIYDGGSVATKGVTLDSSVTSAYLKIGTCTPTIAGVDNNGNVTNGVLTIQWDFTTSDTITASDVSTPKTITMKYTKNGTTRTYSATFSLYILDTDAIYQLNPTLSSINFTRQQDNTLLPEHRTLGLTLTKYDGTSTADLNSCPADYSVYWKLDEVPETKGQGNEWTGGNVTTVSRDDVTKFVGIALFYKSALVDRESVPVVKDGVHGENSVRIDLDNENDSMLYTGGGILVSGNVTSTAYMYDGATDVSDYQSTIFSIPNDGRVGCTAEQATINGRVITVTGINDTTAKITVQGDYTDNHNNTHTKTTTLTIKKIVDGDKYDLVIEPNSIAYNATLDNPATSTISITVWKTSVNNSGGATREISAPPQDYSVTASNGELTAEQVDGEYTGEYTLVTDNSEYNDVIIRIQNDDDATDCIDAETIPINKAENGEGVSSADVVFAINQSGTIEPDDNADWETLVSDLESSENPEEDYLWQATLVKYTISGNTAYTGKVCLGKMSEFASVTEQYALGTQTQATGTWQDNTPPAPSKGSYLWTRTKLVYTSGNNKTSYVPSEAGMCIGYWGVDGTGIQRVTSYYAKQTPTQYTGVPPTTGWESSIAALGTINDGDYLWTKNVTTYTDTLQDTVTYTVSKWGIDGNGIYNIETKFYESDSLLTNAQLDALAESVWKETYSGLALNQGDYIYTRTKITYDRGSTPTVSYTVNRLGIDGVAYVTTEEYYCIGNSMTTPPDHNPYTRNDGKPDEMTPATMASRMSGGNWSEARPTYDASTEQSGAFKYLWNFEVMYDTTNYVKVTQPLCIGDYSKGIKDFVELYTVSVHSTKEAMLADTTERTAHPWVDEVHDSAPTDDFPYQWNKTVTNYTDGSSQTFYHISGVKGTPGKNSVRLALDNEHEDFLYDGDTLVAPNGGAKAPIHLYDGNHEVTLSASALSVVTDDTTKTYGVPTSGDNAPSIITESGINKLKVPRLEGSDAKVTVKTIYLGQDYYAEFTASKTNQDKYDLVVSPSSIPYNPANYPSGGMSITCSATGIGIGGTSLPVSQCVISTAANSGHLRLFWQYVKTDGTKESGGRKAGDTFVVLPYECATYAGLYIELRYFANSSDNDSSSNYRICDYETVEIAKSENGADGKNSVKLDIDNEMDNVETDSTCKINTARTIKTVVHLYDGASEVIISGVDFSSSISGSPASSVATFGQQASGKGKELSWAFNAGQTMAAAYEITITYTHNGVSYSAVFTITASKGQAVWQLKPGMSSISFQRNNDNTLTPPSKNVSLTLVKIDGGNAYEYHEAQTGVVARFSTDEMPTSSTGTVWSSDSSTPISVANNKSNLFIALFNSSGKLLDRETVPVVVDGAKGADGKNSVRLDLDNEMDMVRTNEKGIVLEETYITSVIRCYDGATEVQMYNSGLTVDGTTDITQNGNGFTLRWHFDEGDEISKMENTVSYVDDNGVTHSLKMTIVPSYGQVIYQCHPHPSGIKIYPDMPDTTVYYGYTKNDGTGVVTVPEPESNEIDSEHYIFIRTFNNGAWTRWFVSLSNVVKHNATLTSIEMCITTASRWQDITDDNIVDREVIPVVYDGKDGQSSYKSTMFVRMDITPISPTDEGDYYHPSPDNVYAGDDSAGYPVYWSDGIPSGSGTIWATTRIFTSDGESPQEPSWSTATIMSDSESFDVEFSPVENNPGNPTDNDSNWFDPTLDPQADWANMIWMAERTKSNGAWGSWKITKIKGENGDDAVTYEIVFTEAWAKKDNNGEVRGRLTGNAYKIEGATRTALANTTIRMGYTGGGSGGYTTKTTDSNGYFSSLNGTSDWFVDDWDDTDTCNFAKSIYASIIINNVAVCTEYINISFDGQKGDKGLQGCVVRVSEYETGHVGYRNDEGKTISSGTVGYIDVVGIEDSTDTYGYKFYRYKSSTESTSSTPAPPNSTYWEALTNVGPIYTSLLVAKYGYIKFGTGNQFVITNNSNEVQAGMKGDSTIRIWAGANPSASSFNHDGTSNDNLVSEAPFRVYDNGHVVMTSAEVAGTINASTIKGTIVVGDNTNAKAYMEIVPTTEGTEGSDQVYRADILGKSAGIAGDALDIGVYRLKNSTVMGSHITVKEVTTGGTVNAAAHVGVGQIAITDSTGSSSMTPLNITTHTVYATDVSATSEVTTKKVKGVDYNPVAFPSNIITSDKVELDNNLPAGAIVFAPNCKYVKSSQSNVYASRNDDGLLNNLTTTNGHEFGNKASRIFVKYSTEYWKEFDCQGP